MLQVSRGNAVRVHIRALDNFDHAFFDDLKVLTFSEKIEVFFFCEYIGDTTNLVHGLIIREIVVHFCGECLELLFTVL